MSRGALGGGIFFIIAGIGFLLDELDVVSLSTGYLIPALLIIFGAAIIIGSVYRRGQ
jgi:DMSO reductase anchor subunit